MFNALCYLARVTSKSILFCAVFFVSQTGFAVCPNNSFLQEILSFAQVSEAHKWNKTEGKSHLESEYLLKLNTKLSFGSKDLQARIQPTLLHTKLNLLLEVIGLKMLTPRQVSELLEFPISVVQYWFKNLEPNEI
jgi:hypothetical protein